MDIKTKRKGCIWFSFIGILFFLCSLTCRQLAETGNIIWNASWTLSLMGKSILLGMLVGTALFLGLAFLKERFPVCKKAQSFFSPRKVFLISFGANALCWFPTWLAYYPGICSYDTPVQLEQIMYNAYNTHHPLAHTLFTEAFYRLGQWMGNVNLGIGLCTLLQMLLLGGGMAGAVALFAWFGARKWQVILLTIYCALFPVNWYMGVTTTKDVLFSLFVLGFFVLFYGILHHERCSGIRWHIAYTVSIIGLILFRNNGKYALLVFWVFLAISFLICLIKRKVDSGWKWLLIDTTAGLLIGCVLMSGLTSLTNAREGDKREMLSMPIQQLARTMVYHGGAGVLAEDDNTMNEQDKALVQEFLLNESYKNYRPEISDPVKTWTNTYVVRYRVADFAKTYLNLLTEYPGDFINAAFAINAGWLSPLDTSHATINQNVVKDGHGYIQTGWSEQMESTGLFPDSKFPRLYEKLEHFAQENTYLAIPGLNFLIGPGAYLWCYLFLAAWLVTQKKYRELLPFAWVFGYYGTLFLGPAVQLRYLYPLMIVLPFLWVGLNIRKKEN